MDSISFGLLYLIKRVYCDGMLFQTASLLEEVNKLKDENFLILHGTADGEILLHFNNYNTLYLYSTLHSTQRNVTLKSAKRANVKHTILFCVFD